MHCQRLKLKKTRTDSDLGHTLEGPRARAGADGLEYFSQRVLLKLNSARECAHFLRRAAIMLISFASQCL